MKPPGEGVGATGEEAGGADCGILNRDHPAGEGGTVWDAALALIRNQRAKMK